MASTRQGKIARLPADVREAVNTRLRDGQPYAVIIDWLHAQPEVLRVLDDHFNEQPINPQNLSEWKQGGYQEWLDGQGRVAELQRLTSYALRIAEASGEAITDASCKILAGQILAGLESAQEADIAGTIEALTALRKMDLAKLKLAQRQSELELRRDQLDLTREQMETRTVKEFLRWQGDSRAQEILTSKQPQDVQMDQLRLLIFGDRSS